MGDGDPPEIGKITETDQGDSSTLSRPPAPPAPYSADASLGDSPDHPQPLTEPAARPSTIQRWMNM